MACIQIDAIEQYIHTDSIQYLHVNREWTFRVSLDDKVPVEEDTTVYISYTGSTGILDTTYYGPSRVIIKAGSFYQDFIITIFEDENSYGTLVVVSGTTPLYDSCGQYSIQVLSYEDTPKDEDGNIVREPGTDCCSYYDNTHEEWRDYYPTCMGNNGDPQFPGNMLEDGNVSDYNWYNSELYK